MWKKKILGKERKKKHIASEKWKKQKKKQKKNTKTIL